MQPTERPSWRTILLAVLGLLTAGFGIGVAVNDDGVTVRIGNPIPVAIAPTAVAVDGPDADTKRDDAIPLDDEARAQAQRIAELDSDPGAGGLRGHDTTTPGVLEGPLATQEWPGCRTAFARNFSSRAGATPKVIYWHQTVSRENGWSSQNALTALANNAAAQVSWHFLIGRSDGLCTYTVPTAYKAWTEGNANREGIGIEVEAYGDESTYVTGAGKEKLLAVTRRLGKLYGIPMQGGIVRECVVIKPGIVMHKDADQNTTCAGGHADVNIPGVPELIAELAAGAGKPDPREYLTDNEATDANALESARQRVKTEGGWHKAPRVLRQRAATARDELLRDRNRLRRLIRTNGRRLHRGARLKVLNDVLGPKYR